jgi:DNA invertase Pin-like site-specific DNA recombinase
MQDSQGEWAMSVYGYCRVSTAGQASNNSMADQERKISGVGVASRKIAQGVAEHFSLKVSHVTVCNIVKESRN